MRKILFLFFIGFLYSSSIGANEFHKVESDIYQSINNSFDIHLINSPIDNIYLLIQLDESFVASELLQQYAATHGLLMSFRNGFRSRQILVVLTKSQFNPFIEYLKQHKLLENGGTNFVDFAVLGDINQQKILGQLNLLWEDFKGTEQASVTSSWFQRSVVDKNATILSVDSIEWPTKLLATLIYCYGAADQAIKFDFTADVIACPLNQDTHTATLSDGAIANFKAQLEEQLIIDMAHPASWLLYVSQFSGVDSLSNGQTFFEQLTNISIAEVLQDYQTINADYEEQAATSKRRVEVETSSLPVNYQIRTVIDSSLSDVVNLSLSVDGLSKSICDIIICSKELAPRYFKHSYGSTQWLSFNFSSKSKNKELKRIKNVIIDPFVKQVLADENLSIAQSDLSIQAAGDIKNSDLYPIYTSLAQLEPLASLFIEPSLDSTLVSSASERIDTVLTDYSIGNIHWPAIELSKYWLNYFINSRLSQAKLSLPGLSVNDNLVEELIISVELHEQFNAEAFKLQLQTLLSDFKEQATEQQFELLKGGFVNRIKLLDEQDHNSFQRANYFIIPELKKQLLQAVEGLTYQHYLYYLENYLNLGQAIYQVHSLNRNKQGINQRLQK